MHKRTGPRSVLCATGDISIGLKMSLKNAELEVMPQIPSICCLAEKSSEFRSIKQAETNVCVDVRSVK